MTDTTSDPGPIQPSEGCATNGCDGPCICDHPDDCRCGCADDLDELHGLGRPEECGDPDDECGDPDCPDCYPGDQCAEDCGCAWCTGEAYAAVPRIVTVPPNPADL